MKFKALPIFITLIILTCVLIVSATVLNDSEKVNVRFENAKGKFVKSVVINENGKLEITELNVEAIENERRAYR